ncbi:bifunctional glycosyltransferase/CDP-glycerol:glycerophosphate glycerophosphotransferase [Rhizomonospora bruguierae]|uniref:bifunctional glycosyltransferase/CDP-glycerol:glycerophosphate glycerophosphotransferase n=1 Tax=Rhizomonospora bruguierae TaxID=1581705 RepID=UPI001BCF7990|nr:bifunctional glycosyltransferase/CDP-glycerol:glycerophosphate glycerophosphotransferase [Micromonospora sp. NBRC 107566]
MGAVLSIVVPIYNVAPYLSDCLGSLASQAYRDLEVIMVDDGSTDDSARIAADFAAQDGRFRLVSQENKGLGAARNTGVRHASGAYLMFVDSDDVLPSYALSTLVAALEQSGSDFATGNAYRLNSRGVRQSPLHKPIFAETRLRTHVTRERRLLEDRTAWNKVFRRQFWDKHRLSFPEGVLYEDTPVMVPAHVLAGSVDVLQVPVYYWRQREGPDRSITQRRDELKGFVDRITGVDFVSRFLAEQKQKKVKGWYDAAALRSDLMIFMKVLPDVDDEYRREFLDRCNDFLDRVDPNVLPDLHTKIQLHWHLVRQRMMDELLTLITATRHMPKTPIVWRGLKRYHELPFLDDKRPELPRQMFLAGTPKPRTKLHEVTWEGDRLHLRGHAFIQGMGANRPWNAARLVTVSKGERTVHAPARPRRCPDATADTILPTVGYDWSGFEATIDVGKLRNPDGTWGSGRWPVTVGVVGPTQASRGPLYPGGSGNGIRLTSHYVADDVRVTPIIDNRAVALQIERVAARADRTRLVDDSVEIGGVLAAGTPDSVAIQLSRAAGVVWRTYTARVTGGRFLVRIPLADLRAEVAPDVPMLIGEVGDRWQVEAVTGPDRGDVHPVVADRDFPELRASSEGRELWLKRSPDGHLELDLLPTGPAVTEAAWTGGRLVLRGDLPEPGPAGDWSEAAVVLRVWGAKEERSFPMRISGRSWQVEIDPVAVPTYAGLVQLRTGTWDLFCRASHGPEAPLWHLPFASGALNRLPMPAGLAHREISLERQHHERTVLRVRPALDFDERGPYWQDRLCRREYPALRRHPLRDAVLYNSFTGRQYSDSPRAVHEELVRQGHDLEHLWVVRDGQVALPETATAVRLSGRDWYEALATSRYIVTNQHLPEWFQRREGQVVVQTWHGTPLKRIGHDIADVRFADPGYLQKVDQETPNWSFLLSPNRFSTPILRRAFRYSGEMLEVGYPRNDILYAEREPVAARVRAQLGLPEGRKVVLYAPTWRDDQFYGPGRYKMSMRLDLDRAAERLADDHVLLVRRHPNVVDELPRSGDGFVWDVSTYPDIADLLAVTDVLVTDYSSVMFDFANTRRPMLFFTYDLEHYRDRLRGFYFDFEAEAPGPLLATSDEVIEAVRDAAAAAARHAEAYARFVERACDLDDGHATQRLVSRMLSAGGTR